MQDNRYDQNKQTAPNQESQAAENAGADQAQQTPELPDLDLTKELEAAQAKAAENYDLYVRAVAEADNVRRRASEDISKARKFGIEKFAEAMLPVVDSLEKALEASAHVEGPLKEGVEMTYRQLKSALENNGMKEENPVGLKFDPNTMQAITMVKDPAVAPGCVAQVFQRGWKIADRVLRPAMVAVAQ